MIDITRLIEIFKLDIKKMLSKTARFYTACLVVIISILAWKSPELIHAIAPNGLIH